MKIPEKLLSRKLILALLGVMLPPLCSYLSAGVELQEALRLSVAAILAYLVSQGFVDGKTMEGWVPPKLQAPEEEDE